MTEGEDMRPNWNWRRTVGLMMVGGVVVALAGLLLVVRAQDAVKPSASERASGRPDFFRCSVSVQLLDALLIQKKTNRAILQLS